MTLKFLNPHRFRVIVPMTNGGRKTFMPGESSADLYFEKFCSKTGLVKVDDAKPVGPQVNAATGSSYYFGRDENKRFESSESPDKNVPSPRVRAAMAQERQEQQPGKGPTIIFKPKYPPQAFGNAGPAAKTAIMLAGQHVSPVTINPTGIEAPPPPSPVRAESAVAVAEPPAKNAVEQFEVSPKPVEDGEFVCNTCEQRFVTRRLLVAHVRASHKE